MQICGGMSGARRVYYGRCSTSTVEGTTIGYKRLLRSSVDHKIAGVCGGIAEYYGWDPTLVRIAWIVLTLLGGSGILIYLIMWLVMAEAP